jgi:iron complex outermembrane receptor protein
VTWSHDTDFGDFTVSGACNNNDLSIERIDPNPPELSGLFLADGSPIVQFDRPRLGTYTDEIPGSKFSVSSNYANNGIRVNARATQFGSFTNVATSASNDTYNSSEWIFDLERGFEIESGLGIYAGASNIANTYPAEVRSVGSLGNGFYDTITPYGFTVGSWYLRSGF